jgi:hypothetical protein
MKVTQKDLFNKTAVTKVKELLNSAVKIIYIHGPIGCGKTTTVEVLCKNYDILKIDPDNLRRADDIEKIIKDLNNITGNMSWTEILLKGKKTEKPKVVLIDGIDLCEKTIRSFLENVHSPNGVKIILISAECIRTVSNLSFVCPVAFNKPSLLELCKLIERVDSNKDQDPKSMEELVIRAEFDTRQVLNLIQNRCPSNASKIRDYDLEEKTLMILSDTYSFDQSFLLGSSEPSVLTASVFNNYLNCSARKLCDQFKELNLVSHDNLSIYDNLVSHDNLSIYDNLVSTIDSVSMSDTFKEFDCWETTNVISIFGCVMSSYYLGDLSKVNYSNQAPSTICSLRSKEEIILSNWIKWGAYEKFVNYIKENRLYKITTNGTIDFTLPKGTKVKLTRVQKTKISKMIEELLEKKSDLECIEKELSTKETVVNLQWFK